MPEGRQFPSTPFDRWHQVQRAFCDGQLHAVLRFPVPLDDSNIRGALQLLLQSYPILTSRWVEGKRPYWQQRENVSTIPVFMLVPCQDPASEVQSFLAVPSDPSYDPLLQVRLFRGREDILCAKLSGVVGDALSLKEIISFLATYDQGAGEVQIDIEPEQRPRELRGIRVQPNVYKWPFLASVVQRGRRTERETLWVFPFTGLEAKGRTVMVHHFDEVTGTALRRFAHENGLKVLEVAFAAFVMAMFDSAAPQHGVPVPFHLEMPVEGHQDTSPIAHHYAHLELRFSRRQNLSPKDLLTEIKETIDRGLRRGDLEREIAHVHRAFSGNFLHAKEVILRKYESAIKRRHVPPSFIDLGEMNPKDISYHGTLPTDAYLTIPISFPPSSLFGWGGFGGRYYCCFGFCEYAIEPKKVERFFHEMERSIHQLVQD